MLKADFFMEYGKNIERVFSRENEIFEKCFPPLAGFKDEECESLNRRNT
jgi:hypothetical protein